LSEPGTPRRRDIARGLLTVAVGMLAFALGVGAMFVVTGGLGRGDSLAAPLATASEQGPKIATSAPEPEPTVTPTWVLPFVPPPEAAGPKPTFSKHTYVLDTPASPWVVVNKTHPLEPADYVPADLVKLSDIPNGGDQQLIPEAAAALVSLYAAARDADAGFKISTAYRSYNQQSGIFFSYVREWGRSRAETYAARPGFSEHQTGRAVDIYTTDKCRLKDCFRDTAAAAFVAAHGHEYGFIVRYPDGKIDITGYRYEPWHLRYVGVGLATEMYLNGPSTMEEFFGLPASPNYAD